MPTQKDLKRIVRARMQKTGESYTTARLHVVRGTGAPRVQKDKSEPAPKYARVAGMSDASVSKQTGRNWAEWVRVLDAAHASTKPHREIAAYVSSLGTPDWWSQMVTVGYERIRGLRDKGQRRGGGYEASKSRTYGVPVATLFNAFANARKRKQWLPVPIEVRSTTPPRRMRISWDDGTQVQIGFLPKGAAKSAVAIQHEKLPSRSAIDSVKKAWSEYFDQLGALLS